MVTSSGEMDSASCDFPGSLQLLGSQAKLERDKGALLMTTYLKHIKEKHDTSEQLMILGKHTETLLEFFKNCDNATWEFVFGHLQASQIIIESGIYCNDYNKPAVNNFSALILPIGLRFTEHEEFRVRIAAGALLATLCERGADDVFHACERTLVRNISENLERQPSTQTTEATPPTSPTNYQPSRSPSSPIKKDAKEIFHDTAGWKCLETSMKSLQAIIEACGERFHSLLSTITLELVFATLEHTNRFVRETGYYVCAALARFGVGSSEDERKDLPMAADNLAMHLRRGLSDNWSQVRLAASVATRQFFTDVSPEERERFFPSLLPAMCLNRYYLAEGVRLYNTETWQTLLGAGGRACVERHISAVVDFYVEQSACDNHAVREAACHCMAEMAEKIDKTCVRPHVSALLAALHVCFLDDSWPVRDTACVACGRFIRAFPDESHHMLEQLLPLFYGNLADPIPSVRQGAALALADVTRAYEEEALAALSAKLSLGLKAVESQTATTGSSDRFPALSNTPADYGVVKRFRDNDEARHTDQTMFSCGSLAPKMRRGGGGCSDHSVKRDSRPWEVTDGCVHLLAELSALPSAHTLVSTHLGAAIIATRHRHYIEHTHLMESLCRRAPAIARNIGKRLFKPQLDELLEVVFDALACGNALTEVAAAECLVALSGYIGENILRGRVERLDPMHLRRLDEVMRTMPVVAHMGMVGPEA